MGPGDDGEVILVPQSHCCFYPRYIPLVCISLKLVDFIPPSQLFFRVHGHRNPRVFCVEDKIRFFVLVLETLLPHPTPSPSPLHSIKFHAFSSWQERYCHTPPPAWMTNTHIWLPVSKDVHGFCDWSTLILPTEKSPYLIPESPVSW